MPYSNLSPKSDIEDKEKYFEALKWAIDNNEKINNERRRKTVVAIIVTLILFIAIGYSGLKYFLFPSKLKPLN